jgi:hypothetical protein
MLSRISRALHKYAGGGSILALFVLEAVFIFFIMPMSAALIKYDSGGPGPIDLLFLYTPATAYARVAAYGEYGRSFYRSMELSLDLIYPLVYTLLLGLLLGWLTQRGFPAQSRAQRWNLLPLGAWFFDLLENLGIVSMLSAYPARPALLGWLTAGFTLVKWLFAGASIALIVITFAAAARNRFRKGV